jgi:hypothetical protein
MPRISSPGVPHDRQPLAAFAPALAPLTTLQPSATHDAPSGNSLPSTRASSGSLPPRNARPGLARASVQETAACAAPPAVGAFTEALHADLAGRWPSRYCHRDDNAFVLRTVPSSEDRQRKLVRATIESAHRFAIITSYNINPAKDHEPGKVSGTTFAMLESLARKQHDKDFTFVLLYNRNKLQENGAIAALLSQNVTANMSLKSTVHVPGTTTWPAVIDAYNGQQPDEGLRVGRVKCGIYFVAAKAKGLAGSHHNKFCINDQGLAATLGASIANKTKDDWMDGGCIAVSGSLAASQRDLFVDELMGGMPCDAPGCGWTVRSLPWSPSGTLRRSGRWSAARSDRRLTWTGPATRPPWRVSAPRCAVRACRWRAIGARCCGYRTRRTAAGTCSP